MDLNSSLTRCSDCLDSVMDNVGDFTFKLSSNSTNTSVHDAVGESQCADLNMSQFPCLFGPRREEEEEMMTGQKDRRRRVRVLISEAAGLRNST